MKPENLYALVFASVYPHYVKKAEAKGRTREELDEIIRWLTGYTRAGLAKQIEKRTRVSRLLRKGPEVEPPTPTSSPAPSAASASKISKTPLMQKLRYLDKLVDELAKGKPMEKILRKAE